MELADYVIQIKGGLNQMKNISKRLVVAALAVGALFAGNVWATPVTFTPNAVQSSVIVTDYARWGDLIATQVLTSTPFTLGDGATQTLDFFTLDASGYALSRDYTIEAILAFSSPQIAGTGSGGGKFTQISGWVSAGTLTWDPSTLPDTFLLADGNTIKVNFESGATINCDDTTLLHAYVTNLGGGVAPVPEPGTVVLVGAGLLGLAIYGKRRKSA